MSETIPVAEYIRRVLYAQAVHMCKPEYMVFKADLWNESHEGERLYDIPGRIYSVEFSWFRTERAKCQPNQTKICGNIRGLPFKEGIFDVALDLSTIDHTCGPEHTIKEYSRVLKPGGKVLVASWVGPNTVHILSDIHLDQFIHNEVLMESYMNKYFSKVGRSVILNPELSSQVWKGIPEEEYIQMVAYIGEKEK